MPVKDFTQRVPGLLIGLNCKTYGSGTPRICGPAYTASEHFLENSRHHREFAASACDIERIDLALFRTLIGKKALRDGDTALHQRTAALVIVPCRNHDLAEFLTEL